MFSHPDVVDEKVKIQADSFKHQNCALRRSVKRHLLIFRLGQVAPSSGLVDMVYTMMFRAGLLAVRMDIGASAAAEIQHSERDSCS